MADSFNYTELESFTRIAEDLGYTAVLASDRFTPKGVDSGYEAWMFLSSLAQSTSHIRIGTLTFNLTHQNPALIAKMAGTLDYLSRGRLDFGINTGSVRDVQQMEGLVQTRGEHARLVQLAESIRVLKSLLTQSISTFEGNYYHLIDAECEPKSLQRPWPHLTISTDVDSKFLRFTAEHADSWNIPAVAPEIYLKELRSLKEHCLDIGRDFDEIERTMETKAFIVNSDADFERLVDRVMSERRYGSERPIDRDHAARTLKEKYIIGSIDQCSAVIGEYIKVGVQHFAIHFLDYPSTRTLTAFSQEYLD